MEVSMFSAYEEMSRAAAREIANVLNAKPNAVLGMATGSTPLGVYQELVRMHRAGELDFSHVTTFNLDEYVGLPMQHPQSYHHFMHENFFRHINIPPQNIHIPVGHDDQLPRVLRLVRAADRRVRRDRSADPGHRLRRAHRLQRAGSSSCRRGRG